MGMVEPKLIYVTDRMRHLVCVPYTIDNLHRMADELGIKRCWFHKNHYDIPAKRVKEIEKLCVIVRPRNIVEIIKSPEYAETIIGPEATGKASPQDYFLKTQLEYEGYNSRK